MDLEDFKKKRRVSKGIIILIIISLVAVSSLIYLFYTDKLQAESLWGEVQDKVQGFSKPAGTEIVPDIKSESSVLILHSSNKNQNGETIYDRGKYTTSYGENNVYEGERWKDWKEATSLKDKGYGECIVKSDGVNIVSCDDFNWSIQENEFKIKLSMSSLGAVSTAIDVPIKIERQVVNASNPLGTSSKFIDYTNINLKNVNDIKTIIVPYKFGDKIHVGEKSTIITIGKSASNHSLVYSNDMDPTFYGLSFRVDYDNYFTQSRAVATFNITNIPDTATIEAVDFRGMTGLAVAEPPICTSDEMNSGRGGTINFVGVNIPAYEYGSSNALTKNVTSAPRNYGSENTARFQCFVPGSTEWGDITDYGGLGNNATYWTPLDSDAVTQLQSDLSGNLFNLGINNSGGSGNYWTEYGTGGGWYDVGLRVTYTFNQEFNPYSTFNISATGNESIWVENITIINNNVLITARDYFNVTDGGTKYYIPRNMRIEDIDGNLIATTYNITSGGKDTFNYTMQGEDYLKIGNQSIYIVRQNFAVLSNVTSEINFTHLKINDTKISLYIPFDVNSSIAYDYSVYNNDGTYALGATWNSSGQYGGAVTLDGTNDWVSVADSNTLDLKQAWTLYAWVYINYTGGATDNQYIICKYNVDGNQRGYCLYADVDGSNCGTAREICGQMSSDGVGGTTLDGGALTVGQTNWTQVAMTYNGSCVRMYRNGVASSSCNSSGTPFNTNDNLIIGGRKGTFGGVMKGKLDEVMIINRTLNTSEILNLYNNQYLRYYPQGTSMYNTTIIAGDNRLNVSSTINNIRSTNISLSIWDDVTNAWTDYQNITSLRNYTFTISSSATKINLSYLLLSDSYGFYTPEHMGNINLNTWTSGEVGDTIYPIFSAYQDNNASLVDSGIGYFNVSVNNSNGTVILNINGTTILASNNTPTLFNASYTFSSSGTYQYNWTSYGNGTSHNRNDSNSRYYKVNASAVADTTPPYFTTIPPSSTITYGQNFLVDFEATDETAFGNYSVNWSSNFRINGTGWLYNITPLSAGTYNLNVSINDTAGNRNFTIFNLTVGKATGEAQLYIKGSRANAQVELVGETADLIGILKTGQFGNLNLSIDNAQLNFSTSKGVNYTYDPSSLGIKTVVVNYSGNVNYTSDIESWTIEVIHAGIPVVNVTFPIGGQTYTYSPLGLNYTLDEPVAQQCWYSKNNGVTNSSTVPANTNFTGVTGVEGQNTWTVWCNDTAHNVGYDSNTFYIDTIAPSVNSSTQNPTTPTEYAPNKVYTLNVSVFHSTFPVWVWLQFNGVNYTATNLSANNFNVTFKDLSAGSYNFKWYANDSLNQINDSVTGTYVISQNSSYTLGVIASPSWSENNATEITITGTGCPSGLVCNLYRDSALKSNPDIDTLTGGLYNYTYNGTNTNYSYKIVSNILNITNTTSEADITSPSWTNCRNFSQQANLSFSQSITATDASGIGQYRLNYTAIFNVTWGTGAIYNVSKLDTLQLYNLNLTVNDTSGNRASCFFWINITETIIAPPVFYQSICPEILFGYYNRALPHIRKCS